MFSDVNSLPLTLSVHEISKALGIGLNSAYNLVHAGQISSVRVGRTIRVPRTALLAFLGDTTA